MTSIREDMLTKLQARFDPSTALYAGPAISLPAHWQPYAGDDAAARKSALHDELRALEPYLPSTMAGLKKVSVDAFMVETKTHHALRIIVRQIGEKLHCAYSAPPLIGSAPGANRSRLWDRFQANAPAALTWIYRTRMDGLTDIYGFAGFKTKSALVTMAEEVSVYGEAEWYEDFEDSHDVGSFVEVLSTCGGAYLLLDVSRDQSQSSDPDGLVIYMNEGTPPETVSFFSYLDMFMEIGLVGG